MNQIKVIITFDIDFNEKILKISKFNFYDYLLKIINLINNHPTLKMTWYIRIDNNIKFQCGNCDYVYEKLMPILKVFNNKIEIGWHFHPYILKNGQWQQNTDIKLILNELEFLISIVKKHGLKIIRMGWGFQSNEIMQFLSESGFIIDSSAIPRPQYKWEETVKDWTITPLYPYYPSKKDYRIPGSPSHSILEVPISVTNIKAPYDNENVMRYINLAYHPEILKPALERWIANNSHLVTITHPYELMPFKEENGLLSYSIKSFETNINNIINISEKLNKEVKFLTMSEFASQYIMENLNDK